MLVQGRKKSDPKLKGRISKVNSKDCWVEFDKAVPVTKNPGKYAKDKLEFAPEQDKAIVQPATEAAAGSAALNSSEAPVIEAHVQQVEELNDGDGNGGAGGSAVPTASAASAGTTGWEDCTNIFCD